MKRLTVSLLSMGLWAAGAAVLADPPSSTSAVSADRARICVQVHIGTTSAPDLKCLNAALQGLSAQAAGRAATMTQAQSRPTSLAPTQVGLYNQTATRERLGNAFGHSPFPQRPESTYVVPLLH